MVTVFSLEWDAMLYNIGNYLMSGFLSLKQTHTQKKGAHHQNPPLRNASSYYK